MNDHKIFEMGDVVLQSGITLPEAKLAYKTHGELNRNGDNVIVVPTFYGGSHKDIEPMIGLGKALNPEKYFIIVLNMFGNGVSSSPSNTARPHGQASFPGVTIHDNVVCQHRLVTEVLEVKRVALVTGNSMGALQTNQWGALYPELVERIVPVCGSARISHHNFVFLEGIKAALTADNGYQDGWYEKPPTKGLRAVGRVWAGWALSQAFYREEMYLRMGYSSLEDYLMNFWEKRQISSDANDLLAMLWTWQNADISANSKFNGDFDAALEAINCKAIVMPSRTDLYFPPEDNEYEVSHMPNAQLRPIESIWGHAAGGPGANENDARFVEEALTEILKS